ncbi:MAG: hypothetical protein FJ057_09270 [Cyanobacteria bacterium K_DeepCast_0m_m1_088]|nr:hypothetical protein [Cyanobacteria bacterium K_DeepCast_0m_m1_088]
MIISERHQLIVLHCRKAAGSSLCVSLARLLGPDDLQISALAETMALGIPLSPRVRRIAWRQSRGLLPLFRLLGPRVHRRAFSRAVDHAHRPLLGRKPPPCPRRSCRHGLPAGVGQLPQVGNRAQPLG